MTLNDIIVLAIILLIAVPLWIIIVVRLSRILWGINSPEKFPGNHSNIFSEYRCPLCGKTMQQGFVSTFGLSRYWEKQRSLNSDKRRMEVTGNTGWYGLTAPKNIAWNCVQCSRLLIDYKAKYVISAETLKKLSENKEILP